MPIKKYKNGISTHLLYNVWDGMIRRCYDKNNPAYFRYGKRGVRVCKEWKNNFEVFFNWAIENGWQQGLQVDRFPNRTGNYCPENCRITTRTNNVRNRTNTKEYHFLGIKRPIAEICEITGVKYHTLFARLNKGFSIEEAANPILISTGSKGEKNPLAVLTNGNVIEIFKSKLPSSKLSLEYGVSKMTIWMIRSGRNWKHITNNI